MLNNFAFIPTQEFFILQVQKLHFFQRQYKTLQVGIAMFLTMLCLGAQERQSPFYRPLE